MSFLHVGARNVIRRPSRRSLRHSQVVVAALAIAVFALTLQMAPADSRFELAVSDLPVIPVAFVACGLALRASWKLNGVDRAGWLIVAAGLGAWAVAEFVWALFDLVLERDPFPSVADVFYLGGCVPLVVGFMLLAAARRGLARARTLLDAVALACALSATLWHWLLLPVYRDSMDAPTLELLVSAAYPFADIVLLCCAVILAVRLEFRSDVLAVGTICGGVFAFVAADAAFSWLELGPGYAPGWPDVGWFSGYVMLALAAVVYPAGAARRVAFPERPLIPPLALQALPLAIVPLAVVDLAAAASGGLGAAEVPAVVLAGAAAVAVLVRQVVVLRDNGGLNDSLAAASRDLEARVQERTDELAQLVSVLDATTDFVATIDVGGRTRYVNAAGLRMLELPADETLSGRPILEVFAGWASSLIAREGIPAALAHGTWVGETALLRADGRQLPVSQVIIAHRAAAGRVAYFSTVARDISDRKAFEANLTRLANHDSLTGVFNRRRLLEELEREALRLDRQPLSFAHLDLDNFKSVNDSLGHATGDALLVAITDLIRRHLRPRDVLARLGGDEFAVLMPDTGTEEALGVLKPLAAGIREHRAVIDGKALRVTASFGLVTAPDHGSQPADLMARADMAMYRAKETRDAVCVYSPERDSQSALERERLAELLVREAVSARRLSLFAQPIRSMKGDTSPHFEVLLRVLGPDGTLALPHEFLAIAERTNLIREIDRWVVAESIRLLGEEQAGVASLHVNLSGKAFGDDDLPATIARLLAQHGVEPSRIVFEVTETAAVANVARARDFIHAIKGLGCRFALDDFGVGYSSISHLKNLDVDYLKIDGSFITNLAGDERDQHLVRAVVELARALGKETVAEYVGDDATVALLEGLGVDYGQGFHLGRPQPLEGMLILTRAA